MVGGYKYLSIVYLLSVKSQLEGWQVYGAGYKTGIIYYLTSQAICGDWIDNK